MSDFFYLGRDWQHPNWPFFIDDLNTDSARQRDFNEFYHRVTRRNDWHPDWPALKMNGEAAAL